MDDAERPIRFPVELEQALEHIRLLAHRRHGYLVDRRSTRRAMRRAAIAPDLVWNVVARLSPADFHEGPRPDHHCLHREVWIFCPTVNGRVMYLKIAFRRVPDGPESALVIWSFHQPRFPLQRGDP